MNSSNMYKRHLAAAAAVVAKFISQKDLTIQLIFVFTRATSSSTILKQNKKKA